MNDDGLIVEIRQRVEVYDFAYDQEHCDRHTIDEGFEVDDAVAVVVSGEVIEATPERNRWLFCGAVPQLRHHPRFRGRWLHVSVEYEERTGVAVVTMYRPTIMAWRSERLRR